MSTEAWSSIGGFAAAIFVALMIFGPSILDVIGKVMPPDKAHKNEVPEQWMRTKPKSQA